MVNFGTSIVPIIVALITVTLSPFLAAAISNLTSHNPIVNVLITPKDGSALITLTNNGSAPATNLSLAITSPKDIIQITNIFSAVSISFQQLPNPNNTLFLGIPEIPNRKTLFLDMPEPINPPTPFLQINIPKLAHGQGSLTKLQILNNGNSSGYGNYTGVATYDQGSSLANAKPLTLIDQIRAFFIKFSSDFWFSIYLTILSISYITFFVWYYKSFKPRKYRRGFMIQIRDKILSIHHILNENPMSDTTFDEFMEQWDRKIYYYRPWDAYLFSWSVVGVLGYYLGRRKKYQGIIKDIIKYISAKDYIYIDKLYIKLRNRKPDLKDDELITYNKDCARLAENALTRIPWKNYI